MKWFILLMGILFSHSGFCQFSAGANLSIFLESKKGTALCDSIRILVDDGKGGRISPGIFIEYGATEKLSYRLEVNYMKNLFGPIVYNETDRCAFCPVKKAVTIGARSLEVPLTISYQFVKRPASIRLLLGLNPMFNFKDRTDDIHFNGLHPGVVEVINQLDDTIKPIVLFYSLGVRCDIGKFSIQGRYLEQLSNSFTTNIRVYGREYGFATNAVHVSLGISYTIIQNP